LDLRKLQRLVVDALEDVKGQNIEVYDSTAITELFDRVVVVSGTSNRQTRSLAMHLRDQAKAAGIDQIRIEGEDTGEWVLVDLGDVIVHVMQPAIRQYYNLEELWGAKRVRVRLGAVSPGAMVEDDDESEQAPVAVSKKSATKKPPASKASVGRASAGQPSTAKAAAARSTQTTRAARKPAAQASAARKAPSGATGARKAAAPRGGR
jgi:ribosome-associated protein